MRTAIGIGLLALSIPYAIAGIALDWGASVSMGVVALVTSGGVMLARGRRRKTAPRRVDDPATAPPSWSPKVPAPKVPTIPPPPTPEELESGEPVPQPHERHEKETILPPRPSGPPKLTLIHSDGRRIDVRDYRRRAAGNK